MSVLSHCYGLLSLILLLLPASLVTGGLFEAFPHVDDRQLAVYEAHILQLVGTASASSVFATLDSARDSRFRPLLIGDTGKKRALLSVGIADFRNTSAGPYRELVIAFPACEREEAPELKCGSFVVCQSELPDCSHTYMFRSFVSSESALWTARSFGVDAQLASKFDFQQDADKIQFSVLGPGGSEVLQGAVQVSVPGDAKADVVHNSNKSMSEPSSSANVTQQLSRDGYNLHPYVGIPGVLGPRQARYACAFSAKVSVEAARVAAPMEAGPLLGDLDFQPEGVLHLANVSVMQLPPWGHGGSPDAAPSRRHAHPQAPPEQSSGEDVNPDGLDAMRRFFGMETGRSPQNGVEMVEEVEAPRAPWKKAASKAPEGAASENFPWNLHQDAVAGSASHPARASSARRAPEVSSRPAPLTGRGLGGLGALVSEL